MMTKFKEGSKEWAEAYPKLSREQLIEMLLKEVTNPEMRTRLILELEEIKRNEK